MRTRPYTQRGIRRIRCFRYSVCGNMAHAQWNVCAAGDAYWPICEDCDVELNAMVLRWMGFVDAERMIAEYERAA